MTQQKKTPLTWEEATLTPRGTFGVGNREFPDRELTENEATVFLARWNAEQDKTDRLFVVLMLNVLRPPDTEEITGAWVSHHLSVKAQGRAARHLMGNLGLQPNADNGA